jgi:hypothetical protein
MLREIIQGALTRFMEEKISRVAITPAIDAPLLVLGHELICDLSPLTATAVPRAIERERERADFYVNVRRSVALNIRDNCNPYSILRAHEP